VEAQPRASAARGGSTLVRNIGLAVAAFLAGLLLCELVLRILGFSEEVYVWTDPIKGVAHIPGATSLRQYAGHRWVEINSDGIRGPEVSVKHPAGAFRIALLGDSFIEAFEVPLEQTVGEVLARRLSALRGIPVEVLNFGVGGYGTAQELLTLQHDVWKYSPDLILLAVTSGNDISDNYRPLKRSEYIPYYVYRGANLVLDTSFLQSAGYRSRALWTRRWLGVVQHSRLAQLINRVRHVRRQEEQQRGNAGDPADELGMRDAIHLPPSSHDWKEAWRVTEGILRLIRNECRRKHTPLALVTLTKGIQVSPSREKKELFLRQLGAQDLFYPEKRLKEFGQREGIPVFNLAQPMAKLAEERQVFFHAHHGIAGIGHWNPEGHRVAGELIATWLADEVADDWSTKSRPVVNSR
jgi:lysophospholipase L1-like esterase